jgi:hypothetical protein
MVAAWALADLLAQRAVRRQRAIEATVELGQVGVRRGVRSNGHDDEVGLTSHGWRSVMWSASVGGLQSVTGDLRVRMAWRWRTADPKYRRPVNAEGIGRLVYNRRPSAALSAPPGLLDC